MEIDEQVILELELKYCERCGGLWLRIVGDDEVYCEPCIPHMARLPVPRKRRGEERLVVHSDTDLESALEERALFCAEGGNA